MEVILSIFVILLLIMCSVCILIVTEQNKTSKQVVNQVEKIDTHEKYITGEPCYKSTFIPYNSRPYEIKFNFILLLKDGIDYIPKYNAKILENEMIFSKVLKVKPDSDGICTIYKSAVGEGIFK